MRDLAAASKNSRDDSKESAQIDRDSSDFSHQTSTAPDPDRCWNPELLLVLALSLGSFAARILYLIFVGPGLSESGFPDEKNYYLSAATFMQEHGVLEFFRTERSLWNGPVNPLWVYLWGGN